MPGWLQRHVGTGEGQIAAPVLERARAHYQRKVQDGTVRNWTVMVKMNVAAVEQLIEQLQ